MSRTRRHPGFPARPLLRPGVRLCRREDGHLQLGLAPHLVVVAPDVADVRDLLAGLRSGLPPGPVSELSGAALRLCRDLLEKHLILDADDFFQALGGVRGQRQQESLTAYLTDTGHGATNRLDRRRATIAQIAHQRHPRAARRVQELLDAGGVEVVEVAQPDVGILVSRGEPDRDLLDGWVHADVPHLVVSTSEGVVRAGPFVVPGHTACLRCIDAHHTDRDPRRPVIVAQYAAATAPRDGLPEPIHHDLVEMALIWAVRDVLNWVDGHEPRTWGATVTFDPRLELARTPWRPHAGCGCTWGQTRAG